MRSARRHWLALTAILAVAALGLAGWAALAPLPPMPRERVLVIPSGTGARPAAASFPSRVSLLLGLQDVLVLQNDDDREQVVAGIAIPARTRLSVPFRQPGTLELACSAHPSGTLTVSAVEPPGRGWRRLWWRLVHMVEP
jgi:hypothetical protein